MSQSEPDKRSEPSSLLIQGSLYLIAWLAVAITGLRTIANAGGVFEVINKAGILVTLLLFTVSVILLALCIRNFLEYARARQAQSDREE